MIFFRSWLWWVVALVLASMGVHAAPLPPSAVPDPLKSWVPWVLHGQELVGCRMAYNDAQSRACVWPHQLEVQGTRQGVRFRLALQVMGEPAWVVLPGEASQWPQEVKADGQPLAVVLQDDRPATRLGAGHHVITGVLGINAEQVRSVLLPLDVGTLALSYEGQPIVRTPDADGRVWLQAQEETSAPDQDTLTVRTVRLVDDDIPMRVTTRFDVSVAGKPRELKLPAALLAGFVPEALTSTLPARLQDSGELRVQVRPGNWGIEVRGHLMQPATALTLPEGASEEVWSYQAHTDLRMLSLEGLVAVDPKQLPLPDAWRAYPAYQVRPGQTLKLIELRRGDPEPGADTLGLVRDIWLDFDGQGYTFSDKIKGSLSRTWRLDMQPGVDLGRAAVAGVDQPITHNPVAGGSGVELRQGQLQLSADSRLASATRMLPVTAWQADLNTVSAHLHLPPGWMLLHAGGVDKAEQSWMARWTFWDFFFVFLCTLTAARLLGLGRGALVALALCVSWHMAGAPHLLWLLLLGSVALAKVLPAGKLQSAAWVASRLSVVLMVLVLLPYAVQQIRLSIYPSLERPYQALLSEGSDSSSRRESAAAAKRQGMDEPLAPALAPAPAPALAELSADKPALPLSKYKTSVASRPDHFNQIDPNTKVQTGPGLPAWQWTTHALMWQGPVLKSQQLRLFLLPPSGTLVLRLGSLALMLAALWCMLRALPRGAAWSAWRSVNAGGAFVLVMVLALGWPMGSYATTPLAKPVEPQAPADTPPTPSSDVLEELATKLTAPPDCLPHCADISRLWVSAQGSRVQLRLEVHALADVSLPLPGQGANWRPTQVLQDGQPALVRRDSAGILWLAARAGVSQVLLSADVGDSANVEIGLPMPARQVSSQLQGWSLSGLDARDQTSGALSLSRTTKRAHAPDVGTQADALPAFVKIERTLQLGLRWQVQTRITRLSESRAPVQVKVRLLSGEAVNDSVVRVEDGHAFLQLGNQNETSFVSTLTESAQLSWQATTEPQQIEHWRLEPGPQWHIAWSGLAPIAHQAQGQLMPQWRPWPGESVTVTVSKPAGVSGQTLTLDRMSLVSTPGLRATDVQASAIVRTSQGGNHVVSLPEQVEFLSLTIDGHMQPLRPQGRDLLMALTPGEHQLSIQWRESRGITWRFVTTAFGFNAAGVNARTDINVPPERVILAVGGPVVGPAVLFWGSLLAMIVVAVFLGRRPWTPLTTPTWLLLGLGLLQTSLLSAGLVGAWFFAMAARQRLDQYAQPSGLSRQRWLFNATQVLLLLWAIVVAVVLLDTVRVGLLGYPDMMIAGNGSSQNLLRWYQDRYTNQSTSAWVITIPAWFYRVLMLAWSLWLAATLLKWVKWAWQCFVGGAFGGWQRSGVKGSI